MLVMMLSLLLKVGIAGVNKSDTDRKFRELSRMLISNEDTTLIYKTYDKPYRIKGRIVSIDESERVGKLKQVLIQMDCFNPFWTDVEDLREDIALWEKTFEFPCYFDECVELGVRVDNLIVNVINDGDVESGMTIVFKCNGTVKNPQITNIDTQEKIIVNGEFTAGDEVIVYTQFGNIGVELKRNNQVENILNFLDIDSTFIQLAVGDNILRYGADEGLERLDVSIYHNNLYLGV